MDKNKYGLGTVYFNYSGFNVFGRPVDKKTDTGVFYRAVGVDENFQVAAQFSFQGKYGIVSGYGQKEKNKSIRKSLFKADFDKSSLKGDFYIEDTFYPKTIIGHL